MARLLYTPEQDERAVSNHRERQSQSLGAALVVTRRKSKDRIDRFPTAVGSGSKGLGSSAKTASDQMDPPTNAWPLAQLAEFKAFLSQLQSLGMHEHLPHWTATSSCELNFYQGGKIQESFINWFLFGFNTRGQEFCKTIWRIIDQNPNYSYSIRHAILSSGFAVLFVEPWEGLLEVLGKCIILSDRNQFHQLIAACTDRVPEAGVLVESRPSSVKTWLNLVRNETPRRLTTIGKVFLAHQEYCHSIIDAIRRFGFASAFGLPALPIDPVPISPAETFAVQPVKAALPSAAAPPVYQPPEKGPGPAPLEWTSFLRSRLNKSYIGHDDTETDIDCWVQSALENEVINECIKIELPWFLPDGCTLWDLRNNLHPGWAPLVIALIEHSQRSMNASPSFFPVLDIREAIEKAVEVAMNQVPLLERLIYGPNLDQQQRQEFWLANAHHIVKPPQLLRWLGKPAAAAHAKLPQQLMDRMIQQLQTKLDGDAKIRAELLAAREASSKWQEIATAAELDSIVSELFDVPAPEDADHRFTVPQRGWNARLFLKELSIHNPMLEERLKFFEADPKRFAAISKSDWPARLAAMGAQVAANEDLLIIEKLSILGHIKV